MARVLGGLRRYRCETRIRHRQHVNRPVPHGSWVNAMSTIAGAVVAAAAFAWLGVVLGISILEAPLTFRAG